MLVVRLRVIRPASIFLVFITGILLRSPQMISSWQRLGSLFPNLMKSQSYEGIKEFSSYQYHLMPRRIVSVSHCRNYPQQTKTPLVLINQAPLSTLSSSVHSVTSRSMMTSTEVVDASNMKLLNQNEAIQIDQDLFNEYKFSVDQLMELAGLSVATAVGQVYNSKKAEHVLIITGPGNNGGDGLVVARHLKIFGFQKVTILNARKPSKDLFINLLHQASENDVDISYDADAVRQDKSVSLIVDALFGFSFKPPVRPDFQPLVDLMVAASANSIPVVAVDIPSGWDVEKGPPTEQSIRYMPDMLVSLTAPKKCASYFEGQYHFIGGRFVPKKLADKYSLNLPSYPGTDCIVRVK